MTEADGGPGARPAGDAAPVAGIAIERDGDNGSAPDTMVDPRSGVEETIEIVTPLRSIKGFVARPAEKPSSAVIVAHGGDGLNDETREYCCTLAAAGLLALAPDFGYRHDATLRKDATHLHGELRATSTTSVTEHTQPATMRTFEFCINAT